LVESKEKLQMSERVAFLEKQTSFVKAGPQVPEDHYDSMQMRVLE
jgi:hypothetical protein